MAANAHELLDVGVNDTFIPALATGNAFSAKGDIDDTDSTSCFTAWSADFVGVDFIATIHRVPDEATVLAT